MKSFKTHNIQEKRSHSDLNVKYDSIDIIKLYYGSGNSKNMFVTFTDVNKVGINPHSRYSTPNGIYCYPLRDVIDYYGVEKNMNKLPFAGDAKFMTVFQIRSKKGIQIISKYTESDWQRDYKKLLKYDKVREDKNSREIYESVKVAYKKKNLKYGDKIDIKQIDIVPFFRQFYKDMKSATDSDFTSKTAKKSLKILVDYYNKETSVVEMAIVDAKDISSKYSQYLQHKEIGKLWIVTRKLSETEDYIKGSFAASRWNTILRKILGYNGFIDDGAWGIIYQSEPLQAVFLDKAIIQIVQTVPNKYHNTKKRKFFRKMDDMKRSGMVKKIIYEDDMMAVTDYLKTIEHLGNIDMKVGEIKFISYGNISIRDGVIKHGIFNSDFEFKDVTIEGGIYTDGRYVGCDIKGGKFKGRGAFADCIIKGVENPFDHCTLTRCYLYNANISDCEHFKGSADTCNYYGGSLVDVRAEDCYFSGVTANKCKVGFKKFF